MRWVYIAAGLIALAAGGYMAVVASGGLSSQSAPGLIAMGVVLAVGAASIGHALAGRHFGIAVVIGLGMLAGECGAMLQTAQRITAAREAMRAPVAAHALKRQAAIDDLTKAEAVTPEAIDRTRLETAERAKSQAETAVRDKAADKGCRENCRVLLQTAVDNAQREIEAARSEIATRETVQSATIAKRIDRARAAVAVLPPPQSATPLADNTGLPEWAIDVAEALMLALAINLPASALLALGVKMSARPKTPAAVKFEDRALELNTTKALPVIHKRNAMAEAERFGVAMLRPDRDARLSPGELRSAYLEWCQAVDLDPLPINEIAPALGKLFRKSGIESSAGYAVGVAIRASVAQ
jgi:hypothetical protein